MGRSGERCWVSWRGGSAKPGIESTATALAEIYELPWNNPNAPVHGFSPRGLDIDRNGVVWTVIGSGHLASFDRRKCKGPLNGRQRPGNTALKDGRFIHCQDRN